MRPSYRTAGEGLTVITMPYGECVQRKTATCGHCQKIVYVDAVGDGTAELKAGGNPPSVCHRCWRLVCAQCHAKGSCTPFEEALLEIERKADPRRALLHDGASG
jgi:hypothetical protein